MRRAGLDKNIVGRVHKFCSHMMPLFIDFRNTLSERQILGEPCNEELKAGKWSASGGD